MDDNRTMKDLAQNALNVQDAVNLSGIIHSFSKDISRLRVLLNEELGNEFSTDKLNQHPVCQLYANKITSLTRDYDNAFSAAYRWCLDVVAK